MENNKIMNQIQFHLICIQIAILKNNVDVSMEGLGLKESVSLIDLEDVLLVNSFHIVRPFNKHWSYNCLNDQRLFVIIHLVNHSPNCC